MSYSATSAMNNDPTFSTVEIVGGYSPTGLIWNQRSDLKVSGGMLIRDDITVISNVIAVNKVNVSGQTVVYGTVDGTSGNLTLVGDLTIMDGNLSGNICWENLMVFGNVDTVGKVTFYDEDAQIALLGNCIIDNDENTMLCANEEDTITWRVAGEHAAILQTNGSFQFAKANITGTGVNSFSEGYLTLASGKYSHVEGNLNVSAGDSSHVMGYNSVESGFANHVEGRRHTVTGNVNHVEGALNTVNGDFNTVLSVGGSMVNGDMCHVESEGSAIVNSDTSHTETACKVNSSIGLDHLESHGPSVSDDLQSLSGNVHSTGLGHSDSGQEEVYLSGYATTSSLGVRLLTKDSYGSAIGADTCVNQFAMLAISPGPTNASPFGTVSGNTFTTPINASVGHGHGQLSIMHLRGLTDGLTTGNLSLRYPLTPEVYPELKYNGGDTTVTNGNVLHQLWNVNLTVVGRDQNTMGCFGQNINFIARHDASGNTIQIANVTKSGALTAGTLTSSMVDVVSQNNFIRVTASSSSLDTVHWSATMKIVNSGVMDFTGNLVSKLI
jgi:hypothetical protein